MKKFHFWFCNNIDFFSERRRNSTSSSSSDDEKLRYENKRAPPAPTISKISINLKSNKGSSSASGKLQIKLSAPITAKPAVVPLPKPSVASAFNVDSDDEAEEMPPECKMRMKNIGKFLETLKFSLEKTFDIFQAKTHPRQAGPIVSEKPK